MFNDIFIYMFHVQVYAGLCIVFSAYVLNLPFIAHFSYYVNVYFMASYHFDL